jgi:hypothetical protein
MKFKSTGLAALFTLCALGPTFAAEPLPVNSEADRWLQAASAQLAAANAFSFKAEVWEDFVSAGHKVSTTKTIETQVLRPNRLRMETRGADRSRGFWYDGKSLTVLDRVRNLYGTVAVPDTIEKVLDAAREKLGINLPLEDLLVADPYASVMAAVRSSASFGKADILGTTCQHIAFSTESVDLQLWIQEGPSPLLRKLVITYKQEDTAPQFTAIFSDWKFAEKTPAEAFVFTPNKGEMKIGMLPATDGN